MSDERFEDEYPKFERAERMVRLYGSDSAELRALISHAGDLATAGDVNEFRRTVVDSVALRPYARVLNRKARRAQEAAARKGKS